MHKILLFLLAIIVLAGCGHEPVVTNTVEQEQKISDPFDTSTWQTYTNDEYGFSVKYPHGAEVREPNEDYSSIRFSDGAIESISIGDAKNSNGYSKEFDDALNEDIKEISFGMLNKSYYGACQWK